VSFGDGATLARRAIGRRLSIRLRRREARAITRLQWTTLRVANEPAAVVT